MVPGYQTSKALGFALVVTLVSSFSSIAAGAQAPELPKLPVTAANASGPAQDSEPVMAQFKKTVIFIESDCLRVGQDGSRTVVPYLGTGFLVAHHDDRFPAVPGFTYLVTNRHVAYPGSEDGSPCQIVDYKARMNFAKTDGPQLSQAFSLGPNIPWTLPSDISVDLAVVPVHLDSTQFSYLTFPTSLFLTDAQAEQSRIVEGDSVAFTGLFVQFLGQAKLEPIVRDGKIAMIPGEPIPTTLKALGRVYLIDAHVFGGNSGSPVLINLGGQRDSGLIVGVNYKLLGLVSGYVEETSELKLQPVAGYAGTVAANSGIAMVVPAQQILDLLNAQSLQDARSEAAKSYLPPPAK